MHLHRDTWGKNAGQPKQQFCLTRSFKWIISHSWQTCDMFQWFAGVSWTPQATLFPKLLLSACLLLELLHWWLCAWIWSTQSRPRKIFLVCMAWQNLQSRIFTAYRMYYTPISLHFQTKQTILFSVLSLSVHQMWDLSSIQYIKSHLAANFAPNPLQIIVMCLSFGHPFEYSLQNCSLMTQTVWVHASQISPNKLLPNWIGYVSPQLSRTVHTILFTD